MSDSEKEEPQEPELVIDTDWKEQVAREKEAAKQSEQDVAPTASQPSASTGGTDAGTTESDALESDALESGALESGALESGALESGATESGATESGTATPGDNELPPPPPASFEVLVSMLFTQAMSMLGQIPDPRSGTASVNKPYAKHYIDTLDMLNEKTAGNLSDHETQMLSEALHALRMMYVNAKP